MSNFSPRLLAILILVAGLALLLSSVLCLAFKMTAYTSYMQLTSWGTSMTTVKSPGYGADGWMNLYPKYLMPVARAPHVVAGSIGLVTGLAVTWLAARHLRTKRVLQVRNPSAWRGPFRLLTPGDDAVGVLTAGDARPSPGCQRALGAGDHELHIGATQPQRPFRPRICHGYLGLRPGPLQSGSMDM